MNCRLSFQMPAGCKSLPVVLFFFLTSTSSVNAQTRLPSSTRAALSAIEKDWRSHNGNLSQKVVNFYPVYKTANQWCLSVLAKTNSAFNFAYVKQSGIITGGSVAGIVSLQCPVSLLSSLPYFPGIDYLEVAEKTEPFLNQALGDIRADSVHLGYNLPGAFTGKDVLIGIADWGFDYTHPMFYDTALQQTRILAAWDQVKIAGTPPAGFSHGAVYTTPAQLLAAQSDTFSTTSDTHGSHVAGIAGGSGGGTQFLGIGFESEFLFSQMRSNTSSSLDAWAWMYAVATQQGKRLVINNSWGSYRNNPLDGTSLISQAADAYADSNVVIVFSAGNNGSTNFHLAKTFSSDSVKTRVTGFNYSSDPVLWGQTLTMWGQQGHSFRAQIRVLDASNQLLIQTPLFNTINSPVADTFLVTGTDTVWYKVTSDSAHALNNRPTMGIDVKNTNGMLRIILYSEADSGTVHYWNTRLTIYGGGNTGYSFTSLTTGYANGDKDYGIGHPGLSNTVITCAAHISNAGIASFSSYGPRMDGYFKPDLSAPGNLVTSSLSSFAAGSYTIVASTVFNSQTYEFVRFSGTSMSAPMITGSVALLLQAYPWLSPAQVKNIIITTTREDSYTGILPPTGSTRWGWGKLNIYNAIQSTAYSSAGENVVLPQWMIYPNPANQNIHIVFSTQFTGTLRILDVYGHIVLEKSSQHLSEITLDTQFLSGGFYQVLASGGEAVFTMPLIITR